MDSLLTVLATQLPDTNKVLTLLALAELPLKNTRATPMGNLTVHPEFAHAALQLARQLHWPKGEALAWLAVSIGQEQEGRKDLAKGSLDSALSHSARLPLPLRGRILMRTALFLAVNEVDLDKADSLALLAVTCFEKSARPLDVAAGMEIHARIGIFRKRWVEAIIAYYRAIDYGERHGAVATLAVAYEKTALILGDLGDVDRSERYYRRSIQLCDSIGDHFRDFMAQSNWAEQLQQQHRPEEALALYRSASDLALRHGLSREEVNRVDVGMARCLIDLDRTDEARKLLEQVRIDPGIPDLRSEQAFDLTSGQLELGTRHFRPALMACRAAFEAPERYGSGLLRKEACDCMVKAYRGIGDLQAALQWTDRLQQWTDSIRFQEQANTVVRLEVDREYAQLMHADSLRFVQENHRLELEGQQRLARAEGRRNLFFFVGIGILLVAGGLWSRLCYISRTKRAIEKQKNVSDELLLNILPEEVAAELKANGRAEARHFDNVTILFADLVGFTSIAERLSPAELVRELSTCFEAFDGIMARRGVEKIKTIGDAYMAAGGLPVPTEGSARNTALAGLEMQSFMRAHAAQRRAQVKPAFDMRVGIHTG
ncbi:MAG TPA: adenylate/guanylate cyclase domain-containing protein, partial [Flavobacteriales bacterium]|nr:adenylate/guanylate cyclase domain-containing protein [Flavobacteriales bacterium]